MQLAVEALGRPGSWDTGSGSVQRARLRAFPVEDNRVLRHVAGDLILLIGDSETRRAFLL